MTKSEPIREEQASNFKKILFSSPRLSTSIVLGIEGWALLTLYTSGYGLHPFPAGFVITIGYLTIGLTQFLLGWISDAKYTKWGRRKPFLIILAPLLGISIIFLLLPGLIIDLTDTSSFYLMGVLFQKKPLFLWMLVWEIIFKVSYAVTTPYQAWMAEEFPVNERPKVSQFQNTFNYLGNGIMALFTIVVLTNFIDDLKIDISSPTPLSFLIPVIIFGVLLIGLFYLVAFRFPTEPHFKIESNLIQNLKTITKNKNFMKTVLMRGISGLGLSMITALMLKYLEDALNLSGTDYIIGAAALLLTIFIFLYLWRRSIQKIGKKKTLLYVFLSAVFIMPMSLLGLIPMQSYLILGVIYIIGISATLGGWYLFPYIIDADLAEDDEKKTGELKAGIYAGVPSIALNIFQAGGAFLIGTILSLPQISPTGTFSYSVGLIIFGPIVSVILLISYFYTRKYIELDFKWEKDKK